MLAEDKSLAEWLTWDERAGILAGNAIQFLGLEEELGVAFRRRLEQFRRENGLEGKSFTNASSLCSGVV
jgi:hypothetical protein